MEPEPDQESSAKQKMEQRAIARRNNLESPEMDGTSENPIPTGGNAEERKELVTNPSHNSTPVFPSGNCRICFAPEEASGADPIIQLGCECKDDISFGHESCLKNWFGIRLLRTGILDCELCRSPLGAHLEAIVRNDIPEVMGSQMRVVSRVLLLLQIPPNYLDHLQVPLETPDFSRLPPETRHALEASFERLEQVHRRGENRRSQDLMRAQNLAVHGEGPLRADQLQARILRAAQLRDQFFFFAADIQDTDDHDNRDFDELWEEDILRVAIDQELPAEERRTDNSRDSRVLWEEDVIRVAIEQELPAAQQASNVEDLLDELSLHVDLFPYSARGSREDLIFLPRSMFFQLESVPNNAVTAGPASLVQQAARACRQFTYGRFQMFLLHDII